MGANPQAFTAYCRVGGLRYDVAPLRCIDILTACKDTKKPRKYILPRGRNLRFQTIFKVF